MDNLNSMIQDQVTNWLLRKTASAGVRRVAPLAAALASEVGNVREENQDRAIVARGRDKQGKIFAVVAVADGIGGMRGGSSCAAITLGTFVAEIYKCAQIDSDVSEEWLRDAVHRANQVVFSNFRASGGSTLVAILMRTRHPPWWISVGDSRVYRSSGSLLTQISVDDTIAGQLGRSPDAGSEQLLQYIGMGDALDPHISLLSGDSTDAVVLTTDGVHFLSSAQEWLGQIVGNAPDPGVCVKRLVDLAKWCGGPDNATAAMIELAADLEPEGDCAPSCLEVWDSFGELQIIANGPSREELLLIGNHEALALHLAKKAPTEPKPKQHSVSDEPIRKSNPEISKTRRSKGSNKAKSSGGKRDAKSDAQSESEIPQLYMEFPTKTR